MWYHLCCRKFLKETKVKRYSAVKLAPSTGSMVYFVIHQGIEVLRNRSFQFRSLLQKNYMINNDISRAQGERLRVSAGSVSIPKSQYI